MYQIDNPSAAATQPASTAPGTTGYFTDGSLGGGVAPTIVPAEWLNSVMLELCNAITAQGITLSKNTFNQLATAIQKAGSGRPLGVTMFNSSGTFTPNPLANSTIVEALGAGGAGGGVAATGSAQGAASNGGSCGAYIKARFSSALSGPITVTVGAGGKPGAAGAFRGGGGGTTSFGSYVTAPGGDGGSGGGAGTPPFVVANIGASVHLPSTTGQSLVGVGTAIGATSGLVLGAAVGQIAAGGGQQCIYGFPASGYGAGGTGVANSASQAAASGVGGNAGLCLVWEYA